jgi:hypothetical protein
MDLGGTEALYAEFLEAIKAFGYGNVPEEITATVGTAPTGVTVGCNYRDRLVLGSGNIVYMSRQGNYADWDYGGDIEDQGRAFLYQLSEAGELGDAVTALVPHRDSSILAATANSLWVVEGDPAANGTLKNVSRDVGIVSGTAWTKVGDTIVFLANDGLYSVSANGSDLASLSGDKLPEELSDVDPINYPVRMGYRHSENGVYVFLEGSSYHWFFDIEFKGFWPFSLPVTVAAAFCVEGVLIIWDSAGLFWTFDGEDDNGTGVQSHVLLGPFRASPTWDFTLISALQGAVETEPDGAVAWRLITGETAEEACIRSKDAVDNYLDGDTTTAVTYVSSSGSWGDGRSYVSHPRVRGMWHVLWLQSNDVWAFEDVVTEVETVGRWR